MIKGLIMNKFKTFAALMGLVLTSLEDEIFMKNNVRFRVIGDLSTPKSNLLYTHHPIL